MHRVRTGLLVLWVLLATVGPGFAAQAVPDRVPGADPTVVVANRIQLLLDGDGALKRCGLGVHVFAEPGGQVTLTVFRGLPALRIALASRTVMSLLVLTITCVFDRRLRASVIALADAIESVQAVAGVRSVSIDGEAFTALDRAATFFLVALKQARDGHHDQAVGPLRRAAEAGYAPAQSYLGYLYMSGRGVKKDVKEAAAWLRLAAEQGHVLAQRDLGSLYCGASGHPRDLGEALRWLQLGADQGDAQSQNGVAWIRATSSDPRLLDGGEAIRYGRKAVAGYPDWEIIDTLAAAYARDGDYEMAIRLQERALTLLRAAPAAPVKRKEEALKDLSRRLELFRKHRPYVDDTK